MIEKFGGFQSLNTYNIFRYKYSIEESKHMWHFGLSISYWF